MLLSGIPIDFADAVTYPAQSKIACWAGTSTSQVQKFELHGPVSGGVASVDGNVFGTGFSSLGKVDMNTPDGSLFSMDSISIYSQFGVDAYGFKNGAEVHMFLPGISNVASDEMIFATYTFDSSWSDLRAVSFEPVGTDYLIGTFKVSGMTVKPPSAANPVFTLGSFPPPTTHLFGTVYVGDALPVWGRVSDEGDMPWNGSPPINLFIQQTASADGTPASAAAINVGQVATPDVPPMSSSDAGTTIQIPDVPPGQYQLLTQVGAAGPKSAVASFTIDSWPTDLSVSSTAPWGDDGPPSYDLWYAVMSGQPVDVAAQLRWHDVGVDPVNGDPNGPISGQAVRFYDSDTNETLATATTDANGVAEVILPPRPIGTYNISASFAGDNRYTGADSLPAEFRIITGGAIAGRVVSDFQPSANSPGLAGATVFLDVNGNGVLDEGDISTKTDAEGNYKFGQLIPGSYSVSQVTPPGYVATGQYRGTQAVNVADAQQTNVPLFGEALVSGVTMNFTYLLTIAQHYGRTGTFADGDVNSDGTVNFDDLLIFAQNYGHPLDGSLSGSARFLIASPRLRGLANEPKRVRQ